MRLSGSIRRTCVGCKTALVRTNSGSSPGGFCVKVDLSYSKKENFTRELAKDCVYMEIIRQFRPFNRRLV